MPVAAGDTATFSNAVEMSAVTLDADISLDRIFVAGTRLNLYSADDKTLTFSGETPEIFIATGAVLRVSGARLVSTAKVTKTGDGRFVTVGGASQGLKFASQAGDVELEGECHAAVTVTTGDGNWESAANLVTTGSKTTAAAAYGESAGSLIVGNASTGISGVNGCKKPVFVGSSFSFSADVEMTGSSAYGFTVAFHNDPRGHLAHVIHANDYGPSLGYGADENMNDTSRATRVVNGFGFGIYNLYYFDGFVRWGRNGEWEAGATSSPKIYTASRPASGAEPDVPRKYSVRIDYDSFVKRATLTLTQDQREIVSGGQANVSWSQEVYGVDLVKLCGADEAFLAFTFNEGGRNILATLKNVRIDYVSLGETSTLSVSKNGSNWANRKCYYKTSTYEETGISPYGTLDGSIRAGYGLVLYSVVTGNKDKVPVAGNFRISGKVTDNGTGAHGFAVVLHNDPRGHFALAGSNAAGASFGYSYTGSSIAKSVAFGVYDYSPYNGRVRFGKNGNWSENRLTNPQITTTPSCLYDLMADFDATAKTLTLVLSQDQGGTTAVSTNIFTDVDVPALCGGNEAYLALTSEAGGRSVDVTIDDFKIVYTHTPETAVTTRFFDTFAAANGDEFVSVSAMGGAAFELASSTSFAADSRLVVANCGGTVALGAVAAEGNLSFGSALKGLRVDATEGLWENRKCQTDGTDVDSGLSPYGEQAGSIRAGYGIVMNGSVTGCKNRIPVSGDFRISGKVTENGTGAHGFAVVLHNDPRGHLAHCTPSTGGGTLGYGRGDATRVVNSVGLGILNYAAYNGLVQLGTNGNWLTPPTKTSPKIVTAPRGDSASSSAVRRKYDFSMTFEAAAKTLTLVLSQDQGGATMVVSTNVFTDVDVPILCKDDKAYLTLTTEAGGSTTDVTIDDFRVDYLAEPVTYVLANAVEAPHGSTLMLDGAVLAVNHDNAVVFDVFDLSGAAAFAFGGVYRLSAVKVWRDGVCLPCATYTAENCAWITGGGSVTATGRGMVFLFR